MRNAFRTTEGVDLMVDWPIHAGASLAKSLNEMDCLDGATGFYLRSNTISPFSIRISLIESGTVRRSRISGVLSF
jgi:hypothetical protein